MDGIGEDLGRFGGKSAGRLRIKELLVIPAGIAGI
jgi:hypothetical protein